MIIHKSHMCYLAQSGQGPTDTLLGTPRQASTASMERTFGQALIWHMDKEETKVADLVRVTGVSRDVVNKLLSGKSVSTSAENAVLLAAFYGKSVNQFLTLQDVSELERAKNLFDLLPQADQQSLRAQMEGLLRRNAREAG